MASVSGWQGLAGCWTDDASSCRHHYRVVCNLVDGAELLSWPFLLIPENSPECMYYFSLASYHGGIVTMSRCSVCLASVSWSRVNRLI